MKQRSEDDPHMLEQAVEQSIDGIAASNTDGYIRLANTAWARMHGHRAARQLLGKHLSMFHTEEQLLTDVIPFIELLMEHGAHDGDIGHKRRDGSVFATWTKGSVERDETGNPLRFVWTARDLTERTRTEERLRETDERYRRLAEHVADAFLLYDHEGKIVDVNQRGCESLGYTRKELLGLSVAEIDPSFTKERISQHGATMLPGVPNTLEALHRRRDGSTFPVQMRLCRFRWGERPLFLALARDVSRRGALERDRLRSRKMEAIGRLVGGIAHDFNNMLTPIISYADLLSETKPTGPQIQSYLHEIQNAAKRAAELGGHLSAFSRDEGGEGEVLDLNGLVLDLDRMLRRLIGEDIELVTLTTGHPAPVRADADQIKLALAVLATGARGSMPRGGKLIIETDEVAIDAGRAASHPGVAAGEYVVLSVTEAGPDPYPSETTDLRAGIGRDIAAQGGGYVAVDRQPGRGTTFRLYLPKVDDGDIPGASDEESDPWAAGTETVLLAEDEPAVREAAHRVLHEQGYTVLDAANGHDALGVAREHADEEIALLLTDVVMPLMGGRELAERLAYLHPEARVLYTSGYADATTARYGSGNEGIEFMPKPFTPAELARKVREVLDA